MLKKKLNDSTGKPGIFQINRCGMCDTTSICHPGKVVYSEKRKLLVTEGCGFKRFYVFFIIELKSRKIVHDNITRNPNIRFLRNQFSYFEELYPNSYLIHDNSRELKYFPYHDYEIKGVATTPYSPNVNADAERFIRSDRQECLDWFVIFSEKQLRNILKSYMEYYNKYRHIKV